MGRSIYYSCDYQMIGLGTFQEIGSGDVRVRLNYGKAELCNGCGGPFMWIRRNADSINPTIDSDEVIRLMTPPLEFRERRCLFIFVGIATALILILTIAFVVYAGSTGVRTRAPDSVAYMFFSAVLLLVITEFASLTYWSCQFRNKLLEYVDTLN